MWKLIRDSRPLPAGKYWIKPNTPRAKHPTVIDLDKDGWFSGIGTRGKDPLYQYDDWLIAPAVPPADS